MSLRISGTKGTPCAAAHFDRLIETPVPYRCRTETKIRAVAAAISVAISRSSKWSSARLTLLNTRIPPISDRNGRERDHSRPFIILGAAGWPSVHLDIEFFGQQIEHLLPDATRGPLVGRRHRLLPGQLLLGREIMQRGLAGLLDLGQRVLVLFRGDRVGVIGRLCHGLIELGADVAVSYTHLTLP